MDIKTILGIAIVAFILASSIWLYLRNKRK